MPALLELPTELISEIVTQFKQSRNNIERDADSTTLRNLCLTCRFLREVAQPILFEAISLDNRETLIQLERTIEDRPGLAKKVKTVFLQPPPLEDPDVEDWELWGNFDVEAREFMLRLRNVDHMHIFATRAVPFSQAFQLDHGHMYPLAFPSLRTLHLSPLHHYSVSREFYFLNIAEFTSYFVPSLNTLNIQYGLASEISPNWMYSHLKPGTLEITKLQLLDCYFTPQALRTLLQACKHLRVFKYTCAITGHMWGARPSDELMNDRPMTPGDFTDVLKECKDSLEHICLDMSDWYLQGVDEGLAGDQLIYHDFNLFPKLSHLDIQASRLPCKHEMPPALESLDLRHSVYESTNLDRLAPGQRDKGEKILQDVYILCAKVLETKLNQCPSLREVSIDGYWENGIYLERIEAEGFGRPGREHRVYEHAGKEGRYVMPLLNIAGVDFMVIFRTEGVSSERDEDDWRFGYRGFQT